MGRKRGSAVIAPKPSIKQLNPYVPGRSIESVMKDTGISTLVKLSSNESLWGPSPRAIEAAQQAVASGLTFYPESDPASLYETLGRIHHFAPTQLIVGNGADELLELIAVTYAGANDEVIYPVPSFSAYRHGTLMTGARGVTAQLTPEGAVDLDDVLNQVTDRTRIIFLCTPNNPTGGIIKHTAWESFLAALPDNILVVLDQAYVEFANHTEHLQAQESIAKGHPVIMVRTLSKIYALAGLRIGWAAAPDYIISPLKTARQPFSVNRVALSAAQAALEDQTYIQNVLSETIAARQYMARQWQTRGYSFWPSYANFVTVDLKSDARVWAAKLEQAGFITRPASAWGLPHHLRVTVAPIPILEQFFAAFDAIGRG
ncbi:histidinol-phosphate transaminase [Sulfobacillus sp. hq2]|nr:histidinol-phosphate transaminase [Sulfobacillus sp. hq2]